MANIQVRKLHTLLGHNNGLYSLEAYNDSQFFAAGSEGLVVRWDLASPGEGEVIAKVNGSIYSMAFDPEDQVLYVGENNEGIHKIDLREKKEIGSIGLGNHQIFDIQIRDGRIWCALESGELVILNKALVTEYRQKLANERLRSLDFANDLAAIGASDNSAKIFSSADFSVLRELDGHTNSVFTAKFHPSGKYLISGGRDAQLKVWDTAEDYVLRESIAAHLYTINDLVFSEDGKYFVTCSMDKSIKLWNALNFKLLKVLDKHRHAGHGNSVNKLLWMKYQDLLVSCSDDRSISVWEIKLEE